MYTRSYPMASDEYAGTMPEVPVGAEGPIYDTGYTLYSQAWGASDTWKVLAFLAILGVILLAGAKKKPGQPGG